MTYQPGPPLIDPGCQPGGLVICTYSLDGECLTEDLIDTTVDPASMAVEAHKFVAGLGPMAYVMVVYDGDSGRRMLDIHCSAREEEV